MCNYAPKYLFLNNLENSEHDQKVWVSNSKEKQNKTDRTPASTTSLVRNPNIYTKPV